jgi:DnaJ-class molecular chaperone
MPMAIKVQRCQTCDGKKIDPRTKKQCKPCAGTGVATDWNKKRPR